MKATLTIEVSNSFVKGQGKGKCRFYEGLEDGDRPFCDFVDDDCNADNCPLEIQDIPEDIPMEYFENGGI